VWPGVHNVEIPALIDPVAIDQVSRPDPWSGSAAQGDARLGLLDGRLHEVLPVLTLHHVPRVLKENHGPAVPVNRGPADVVGCKCVKITRAMSAG